MDHFTSFAGQVTDRELREKLTVELMPPDVKKPVLWTSPATVPGGLKSARVSVGAMYSRNENESTAVPLIVPVRLDLMSDC
jgi:hypothetical protein